MTDPFDLQRFVDAQEPVYADVLSELKAGRKRSHWMWFVFPQMRGLGQSTTAFRFGISGREEAQAYFEHATLGQRLRECTGLVQRHAGRSAFDIFGTPDDLKFRSSMSLFDAVEPGGEFRETLSAFFGGVADHRTLALLAKHR